MERPIEFITTDSSGKPKVTKEMREIVMAGEKPLVIVTIAGVYRTGKSYLMTRLAQQKGEYFPLGSTVQSKTKGLWAWMGPHPTKSNLDLMLIDTEGLADPEKGSKEHDTWIFILALLLSNIFIFNSKGAIDAEAIRNLYLTAELSDHIASRSSDLQEDGDEEPGFKYLFPTFIWALRDFVLETKIDGKQLERPNEYLEWALRLKVSEKKAIKESNQIKSALRKFFPERHCFLFPIPVKQSSKMKELDTIEDHELAAEFKDESKRFVDFVLGIEKAKEVHGKALNGRTFMTIVDSYVEAIRNKSPPCIENAVELLSQQENGRAHDNAMAEYNRHWKNVVLPVSLDNLMRIHSEAQARSLNVFKEQSLFDKDGKAAIAFSDGLQNSLDEVKKDNMNVSISNCKDVLINLAKDIERKMKIGAYLAKGGYAVYEEDIDNLKKQYQNTDGLGDEKAVILEMFLSKRETERQSIMKADKKLTKAAKLHEEGRAAQEKLEQENKIKAMELERMKQEQARNKEEYEKAVKSIEEKMRVELHEEKEELQQQIRREKEEYERLTKEGFKEEASLLRETVQALTTSIKSKDAQIEDVLAEMRRTMEENERERQRQYEKHREELREMEEKSKQSACCIQ